MNYYLAPLEGITTYIFRNAVATYFGNGITKYYTPFLVPHTKVTFSDKEINDICKEHNECINLIPQILTNSVQDFIQMKDVLHEMGFMEVNLNLGCPSRTVTSKGRGSGALGNPEELDRFLDGIFSTGDSDISVKTRIGVHYPEEFVQILEIYNKYPIKELTIHPRLMDEQYRGIPHRNVFLEALKGSKNPVCYNGDINSQEDFNNLMKDIKTTGCNISAVMIGRGMLRNPGLIRELSTGQKISSTELKDFMLTIMNQYDSDFSGQVPVLFKMKEIWCYLKDMFPDQEKHIKKILKTNNLEEYKMLSLQVIKSL